jgi:hypothetical protein
MNDYKLITCPNCDGAGSDYRGPGALFSEARNVCVMQPRCGICAGVGKMVCCYSCQQVSKINLSKNLECAQCNYPLSHHNYKDLQ